MITETAQIAKLLYTPEEAAQALGISRSKLYVLLAAGESELALVWLSPSIERVGKVYGWFE